MGRSRQRSRWVRGAPSLFCIFVLGGAASAELPALPATASPQAVIVDPYAGVVSNATITVVGQEFYREFVTVWREVSGTNRYSVAIFERPSARWGSLVWVEFANRSVFKAFLFPGRRGDIKTVADQAAHAVSQRVVDIEVQRLLFKDPDLGAEEL